MGAWGYGYQDNDDYHNNVADFSEPLMDALANVSIRDDVNLEDFRSRLMWTVKLFQSYEEFVLSDYAITVFRECIRVVRAVARGNSKWWSEPELYFQTVEEEMKSIEEWLLTFQKVAFLDGRMDLLAALIEKEGHND